MRHGEEMDEQEFTKLYQKYEKRFLDYTRNHGVQGYRYTLRSKADNRIIRVSPGDDAEEVLQRVFVGRPLKHGRISRGLLTKLDRIQGEEEFRKLVYGAIKKEIGEWERRKWGEPSEHLPHDIWERPYSAESDSSDEDLSEQDYVDAKLAGRQKPLATLRWKRPLCPDNEPTCPNCDTNLPRYPTGRQHVDCPGEECRHWWPWNGTTHSLPLLIPRGIPRTDLPDRVHSLGAIKEPQNKNTDEEEMIARLDAELWGHVAERAFKQLSPDQQELFRRLEMGERNVLEVGGTETTITEVERDGMGLKHFETIWRQKKGRKLCAEWAETYRVRRNGSLVPAKWLNTPRVGGVETKEHVADTLDWTVKELDYELRQARWWARWKAQTEIAGVPMTDWKSKRSKWLIGRRLSWPKLPPCTHPLPEGLWFPSQEWRPCEYCGELVVFPSGAWRSFSERPWKMGMPIGKDTVWFRSPWPRYGGDRSPICLIAPRQNTFVSREDGGKRPLGWPFRWRLVERKPGERDTRAAPFPDEWRWNRQPDNEVRFHPTWYKPQQFPPTPELFEMYRVMVKCLHNPDWYWFPIREDGYEGKANHLIIVRCTRKSVLNRDFCIDKVPYLSPPLPSHPAFETVCATLLEIKPRIVIIPNLKQGEPGKEVALPGGLFSLREQWWEPHIHPYRGVRYIREGIPVTWYWSREMGKRVPIAFGFSSVSPLPDDLCRHCGETFGIHLTDRIGPLCPYCTYRLCWKDSRETDPEYAGALLREIDELEDSVRRLRVAVPVPKGSTCTEEELWKE